METDASGRDMISGIAEPGHRESGLIDGENNFFRDVFDVMQEPLAVLDSALCIIYANQYFYTFFKSKPDEILGKDLSDVRGARWNLQELRPLLEDMLKRGAICENIRIACNHSAQSRAFLLHARSLPADAEPGQRILLRLEEATVSQKSCEPGLCNMNYFDLVEQGNDGIVIIQDDVCIFANSRFSEMTSYPGEENTGRNFLEYLPETYKRMISKRLQKVLRDTRSPGRNNEVELLTKAGDSFPAEISFSYVKCEEKPSVMLNIRDIRERKASEAELKASREKYSTLVEESNDGIIIIQEGTLKFTNRKFSELTGYSREELSNRQLTEYVPDIYRRMLSGRLRKVLKDMRSLRHNNEVEFVTKSGALLPAEIGLSFISHEGQPSVMINIRDISDRKRAEAELRDSEKKYSTLVEKGNDGIIIVQDEVLVFSNMKFCEISGFSKEELLRRPFEDFLQADYKRVVMKRFKRSLEKNRDTPLKYEVELLSKEGSNTPAEINSSVIEHDGKPAVMAIIRDITHLKNKEKRLLELIEVQKIMESVIKSSPAVIFFWKPEDDWPVEFVSENISQFGYDADDFLSGKLQYGDIVHPSDISRLSTETEQWCRDVENLSYEYRLLTRSGEVRWVDERSVVKRDPDGNVQYVQGIVVDITERKNVKNFMHIVSDPGEIFTPVGDPGELFDQLLEFATQVENMDSGVLYLIDESTGDLNLVAHKGFSPEFIKSIRHHPTGSIHKRVMMTEYPLYTRYYELNSMIPGNKPINERLEATAIIPVKHSDEVVAILMLASHSSFEIPFNVRSTLETIAAQVGPMIMRMRGQVDIHKDMRNLKVIFETIQEILFVIDNDGCILYVNPFACRCFDHTEEELKGTNILKLHPQNKLLEAAPVIADMIDGRLSMHNIPFEARSKKLIPAQTRCTLGQLDGKSVVICLSRVEP
ncbi:MAG: PAS domain S-box protein [Methanolobus sp.]|uniref:PAS domain S-box protein n=1 Tax=Methanolobus sp. TaxID=1874737 RepID=UPI00272FA506|nr:PAS domain S-box protein [Methanolobus sp.]MDP2217009.1 PAS domain S-box protein [Methanolobus sp.]